MLLKNPEMSNFSREILVLCCWVVVECMLLFQISSMQCIVLRNVSVVDLPSMHVNWLGAKFREVMCHASLLAMMHLRILEKHSIRAIGLHALGEV